jgi:hypothetical protein
VPPAVVFSAVALYSLRQDRVTGLDFRLSTSGGVTDVT